MSKVLSRYYRLLYAGYVVARQHATSYLAAAVSSFFWFLIIMLPAVYYSDNPEQLVAVYTPAYLALFMASAGANSSAEFLRWYVYEGLTDVYREAGLGVYHYTVSTWLFDFTIAIASYTLLATTVGYYTKLGPLWFTRLNPLLLPLILVSAFSTLVFFGGVIALLYTHTRLGGSFHGLVQMAIAVSAYTPLWRLPNPLIGLLNPAVYLAEVTRLIYGYSTIPSIILLALSPALIVLYFLAGYSMFKLSDRVIARYGLEFRV